MVTFWKLPGSVEMSVERFRLALQDMPFPVPLHQTPNRAVLVPSGGVIFTTHSAISEKGLPPIAGAEANLLSPNWP